MGLSKGKRTAFSRPNCTHVSLSRLYGAYACDFCHRPSPLGWVYFCDQDIPTRQDPSPIHDLEKSIPFDTNEIVREFQMLNMNRTVIEGVRNGEYSEAQIAKLRDQKRSALYCILAAECFPSERDTKTQGSASSSTCRLSMPTTKPYARESKRMKRKRSHAEDFRPTNKCELKVCHHCRPSMRERVFISFESVFSGKIAPPDSWIKRFMPVKNTLTIQNWPKARAANIIVTDDKSEASCVTDITVRTFSTDQDEREVSKQELSKSNLFYTQSSESKKTSDTNTRTERAESRGFRTSLRKALEEMLKRNRESLSDSSSLTRLENSGATTFHDASEERLEYLLYKSMSDKVLNEAAATALPDDKDDLMATDGVLYEIVHDDGVVEAGLAFTEEAALMHTPDFITQA